MIVVDDGITTGATVKAALRGLARNHPARLVLAVPVALADTVEELSAECDELVCLATPDPFYAWPGTQMPDARRESGWGVVWNLLDPTRPITACPKTPRGVLASTLIEV